MPERVPLIAPIENRAQLGYDILFDITDYQNLYQQKKHLTPQEFTRKKTQLDALKRHNLESALGERFNAEVLQVTYHLIGGQLFNTDHDNPFLEIVQRGQKHREQQGSDEIAREKAEVTGFTVVQKILADNDFEGKAVVISPRSNQESIYQHNYFDVYTKQADGIITMSRVSCKFNYQEFYQAAVQIDPFSQIPAHHTDADFLANPLISYKNLSEIHQIFSPAEETLTLEQSQQLLEICNPLITSYLNALASEVVETHLIIKLYNAILNVADDFVLKPATRRQLATIIRQPQTLLAPVIEHYGTQPVRSVVAGCGRQVGYSVTNRLLSAGLTFSPWSVVEFATTSSALEDEYGTLEIHCRECGITYLRNPHKLEERCRYCGGTKGIAC